MGDDLHPGHHAKEYQSPTVVPFWPEHLLKELVVGFVAVFVLVLFSHGAPVPLGARADPGDWAFQPAPDRYFCWVQNLFDVGGDYWNVLGRRSLDWILMFALPTVGVMVFIGVLFIERHKERRLLTAQ